MKKNFPSFDDLVFEGRNKAYGAYELRQLTDRHNAYGLFITGSAFLIIVLLFSLARNETPPLPVIKPALDVSLTDLSYLKPERPELKLNSPPPAPPVSTEAFTEFNPTANDVVTATEAPRQEELIGQHIGTEQIVSNTPYTVPVDPAPVIAGTGTVSTADATVISTPVKWAPVMPSFVGGPEALKDFLHKHISIAQSDIERGVSGKVWLRFYVDVDGTVKDVTVIKDTAGGLCAERALKAVRNMPKWNPGMQDNKPVRVYYNLPITFEVKEMY